MWHFLEHIYSLFLYIMLTVVPLGVQKFFFHAQRNRQCSSLGSAAAAASCKWIIYGGFNLYWLLYWEMYDKDNKNNTHTHTRSGYRAAWWCSMNIYTHNRSTHNTGPLAAGVCVLSWFIIAADKRASERERQHIIIVVIITRGASLIINSKIHHTRKQTKKKLTPEGT